MLSFFQNPALKALTPSVRSTVFGRFLQVERYGHDITFSVYVFISHILCTYFPWKTSKEIELRAEAIRCPLRKTGAF